MFCECVPVPIRVFVSYLKECICVLRRRKLTKVTLYFHVNVIRTSIINNSITKANHVFTVRDLTQYH